MLIFEIDFRNIIPNSSSKSIKYTQDEKFSSFLKDRPIIDDGVAIVVRSKEGEEITQIILRPINEGILVFIPRQI